MSKKLFALMSILALGGLGFTAASMRPASSVGQAAATTAKPVVETKVIHRTVRETRRAKPAPVAAGVPAVRSSAVTRPAAVTQPVQQDDDGPSQHETSDDHDDDSEHGLEVDDDSEHGFEADDGEDRDD